MGISGIYDIVKKVEKSIGLDLAAGIVLASLLLIFALALPDGNVLRIIFGLPFLLFLPGYSLVSALWVKQVELEPLERVGYSLGLSLAMVPIVGLGLNYTPSGITLLSVVLSLYIIIILLNVVAWFRRRMLSPGERFTVKTEFILTKVDTMKSTDTVVIVIVIIAIVIGFGLLSYIAMNLPSEQYSEIFILDSNGTTENYPTDLDVNESASIIVNVVSHEQEDTDYQVVVTLESQDNGNVTLQDLEFSLTNKEEWEYVLNFSVNESGLFKLNIELIRGNEEEAYATNHLWIDVRD
jgi:uncharacterized membrane protein